MEKVLLLDRNYLAISILPTKRAINLLVKGKAEIVGDQEVNIKTGSGFFRMSTIIKLVYNIPYRAYLGKTKFSRKNVIIRDNFECKYCGEKLLLSQGTIDHIVPVSKGGLSNYSNCVACCKECNKTKGNKSLDEVGFTLKSGPRTPTIISLYKYCVKNAPVEWQDYLIGI